MPFDEKARKKSHNSQQHKYGAGYSDEMRRRASLRKTFGTGGFRTMKLNDPERFAQVIAEREKRRVEKQEAAKGQDFSEIKDRTQEV